MPDKDHRDIVISKVEQDWEIISSGSFKKLIAQYNAQYFGNVNVAPINFREVSESEFSRDHYHTDYPIIANDYRQLIRNNDGTELEKRIHGTLRINSFGYGWLLEKCHSEGKVRYYFFELCLHDYETTKKEMCYWKGKCKKCGQNHVIDSSD